jgi:hypothetical protein
VALQGSLDAFALADVLHLLGSTRKTGRLVVRTPRGVGGIWLDGGAVTAVEAPGVPAGTDVVIAAVHLLRHRSGEFTFDPSGEVPSAVVNTSVGDLLGGAEEHLATWAAIDERLPDQDAAIGLDDGPARRRGDHPGAAVAVDPGRCHRDQRATSLRTGATQRIRGERPGARWSRPGVVEIGAGPRRRPPPPARRPPAPRTPTDIDGTGTPDGRRWPSSSTTSVDAARDDDAPNDVVDADEHDGDESAMTGLTVTKASR